MLVKEKFRGGIMKEQEFISFWKTNHRDLTRQRAKKSKKSKADTEIISNQQESSRSDGFEFGGEDDFSFISKHSSSGRMSDDRAASAGSAAGRTVRGAASAGSAAGRTVRGAASAGRAISKGVNMAADSGTESVHSAAQVSIADLEALKKAMAERENNMKKQLAETLQKAIDEQLQKAMDKQLATFNMLLQEITKKIEPPTVGSYFIIPSLLIIYILSLICRVQV